MLRRLLQSTHHYSTTRRKHSVTFRFKTARNQLRGTASEHGFFLLIPNKLPDAYERLLLDAMRGDALLYSRSDALELSWHYLAPLIDHWEKEKEENLVFYPAGSPIPREITHIYSHPYVLEAPICTPNP